MKVLIAFDGSAGSQTAVDLVAGLHLPTDSAIRLVEFVPSVVGVGDSVPPMPMSAGRLVEAARRLARPGVSVDTRTTTGDNVAEGLLAAARDIGADLIVAGHRGHGPLTTVLVGSVARDLAESATCPVLIARRASCRDIVLADDGSEGARRARQIVAQSPLFTGLPVVVVSVAHAARPMASGIAPSMRNEARVAQLEVESETRRAHEIVTEQAAAELRLAGHIVTAAVRDGDPAEQVVDYARGADADLIAVGTRGRGGIARAMLGSVARAVLLTAPCSVLVVPSR